MPQLIDLVNRYYNPDLSGQYESYRPAPPPQREVDPRKALESDEIPFEVFQELQRRFRAMPKRSPERRYGIVEATDPKTGKGYKWDRYAAQREQGFRPRRDWGHIRNAFKYEGDRRRGILQANLGADAEERAEAEKAFANEVAGYKYEEQLKALGVEEHNKNLDRAATARHRRGVQQAAMEAARQLARHRATMLETPRAVHPEQLDLWRSQTEYNRGGRGRTGDPTYAQEDSLKLAARRDQIMTTIDEIEAGIAAVEGMAPGAIRSRIFKPSREVGIGKYTESVGYDEREDFVERYKDQLRDLKAEQRTIELELYRRGEGPAPGGPGGAPNPTPTVAVGSPEPNPGQVTTPEVDPVGEGDGLRGSAGGPALTQGRQAAVAQSGISPPFQGARIVIPSPEEWANLSPKEQAFYNELVAIQQEGGDIQSQAAVQWAAQYAERMHPEGAPVTGGTPGYKPGRGNVDLMAPYRD
jgi:hypothetical protein